MSKASVSAPEPSSISSAVFNMINAILGAGLVSLPYAWAKAGFILGWVLFILTAVGTCFTLEVLIDIGHPLHERGEVSVMAYEVLVERIVGRWGRWLVLGAQFVYAFGIAIGYVVIIHDEVPTAMQQITSAGFFDKEILVVIIVFVGLLLPLSLLRTVGKLAKVSMVCFLTAFVLTGIVIYELATDKDELCEGSEGSSSCSYEYLSAGKSSVLSVYGIFVFTKACHHTQFQIYRSLGPQANPENWRFVARVAILTVSVITSSCSMCVYALFGQGVESDFFKSFWKDSDVISTGRLLFATIIMLSFPMQLFVCRETVQVVIAAYLASKEPPCDEQGLIQDDNLSEARSILDTEGGRERTSPLLHYGTTISLFVVILGVGLSTDSLGAVLSLVGGTAGATIAFILPGLVVANCEKATGIVPPGGKRLGQAIICFGIATALITAVFTFV